MRDSDYLRDVDPNEVIRMLTGMGWRFSATERQGVVIGHFGEGESVAIPIDRSFRDYSRRLDELLEIISEVTLITKVRVAGDLLHPPADKLIISLKCPGGLITLEHDAQMHDALRDLCRSALSMQQNPRKFHGAIHGKMAQRMDSGWKVAPSKFGSHELQVVCPLGSLEPEFSGTELDFGGPRLVSSRSRRVLEVLHRATTIIGNLDPDEPIEPYVSVTDQQAQLSFNLCDALMSLQPDLTLYPMEIQYQWSTSFDVRPSSSASIDPLQFRAVERIAERLAPPVKRSEPRAYRGWVKSLHRHDTGIGQRDGDVVLDYLDETGRRRRLRAFLGSQSYGLAIRAFEEERQLELTGTLFHRPRVRRLEDVLQVNLVDPD